MPHPRCVAGHGEVLDELMNDGVRAVEVVHPPGLAIASHMHETEKLVVLLDGGASERIGATLVDHQPLAVMVRPRRRAHENQYHAAGARSLVIEIDDDLDGVADGVADGAAVGAAIDAATAQRHGRRLLDAFRAAPSQRAAHMHAAIRDLRDALAQPVRPAPRWLEAARDRLFSQLAAPPTLAELAREVGVHPVHLAQSFQRRWEMTPRAYVRAHRIFRAIELIGRGIALAEVATETGFADQSHMTRAIQGARHASPGALRRAMHPKPVQDRARRTP